MTRSDLRRGDHRLGVGERAGQRLLAEYVLARGEEALDDLAVQVVGHHDADRIDVGCVGDRPPVVLGALVAVSLGGVIGDRFVHVRDGHEAHIGPIGAEKGCGTAVSGGMRSSGHPAADDGYPD